jgi:hypothetical protein
MSGRRRRGGGPSLKIIKWRDIPAQVNGTSGDQKVQVELPHRFQKAIDRAAMVAGLKDANSYIAEMGAESRPADGDIEAAVAALVAEIEAEFTPEHLNTFVATGGFDPNTEGATADEAAAAAAEADDALAIDPNA